MLTQGDSGQEHTLHQQNTAQRRTAAGLSGPGGREDTGEDQGQASLCPSLSLCSTKLGVCAALLNQTHKLNHAELISPVPKTPSMKVRMAFEIFPPREWVCLKALRKLSKRKSESFWFLEESHADSRTPTSRAVCTCGPMGASPQPRSSGEFRGKPDPPHGHFLPLLPTLRFSLGKFSGSFSMIVFLINSPCIVFELFNRFIAS